ncbi:MAG TPA: PAS domain S-box protein [Gaiellaceae bacterium]|nr:PAS domain S-box protein [Gaiellaceae bacterium]
MATLDLRQSTIFSRLRGLLEVTRLVRTGEELPELLGAIARTASDSLAFRTVVINLYRQEWDDFIVSTVYGSDEAREALLGQVRQVSDWEPLLDERFLQRGAYLVPYGEFNWESLATYTPDLPVSDDPNAWHPDDALFAPMRGADGRLLGILSVDEPISGRKPSGDEIDVLVAVSEHAALAVQTAQEASRAKANREALERLLAVSASLNESSDTAELLQHVCAAISEALGFEKVAVQLLGPAGLHESAASVGFREGENIGAPMSADQLERLLRPEFDVAGCYLIPHEEARRLLPERPVGYRSQRDGRGPFAWHNDWLFVPLHDRRARRIGYIWADDPLDRLRPEPERLQILRAFANQATTALEQASQFEEIQNAYLHHRALIDASPVAIVDFELDGRVRAWNKGATEIFGFTAEEAMGRVNPTVPEDEVSFFLDNMARISAGETMRDIDVRRLHRDGSLIDVSISAGPIRDAHGAVIGAIALLIDITARKRSERALLASEGRKDAVLRASLDCAVIVDHEGLVTEVNPATEETFGWTRPDAVGKRFLELVVAPEHRDELAEVLKTGTGPLLGARLEITALRSDHRTFPAEVAITRVDVPGPLLFAVSLRDVTKRREREERLKQAEAKYRTLVEQIPLATYINDTGMPVHTQYMSPQIETMLGYPVSDWLQPNFFFTCVHPDDEARVLAEVEKTHNTGEDFRCEYRLIAADGRTVWVLDETVAVRDDEYRPIFLQGFLVDVTDRRASDHALRDSEELHRLVVEGSRDLITLLDPAGKVQYASPAVQTILGWQAEEVQGRQWADDVHPDDVDAVNAYFKSREAGGDVPPLGVRVRHKDGSWVGLEGSLSPTRTPDGTVTGFVGVSRPLQRSVLRPAAS